MAQEFQVSLGVYGEFSPSTTSTQMSDSAT